MHDMSTPPFPPTRAYCPLAQDDKSRRALVKEAAWVASNVAAGRQEHRDALVAQGSLAALTSLLVSDQLDPQQEAAYGIWNIASHDQEILVQASKNEKVIGTFVALVLSLIHI